MAKHWIGLNEAHQLTLGNTPLLPSVALPLHLCVNRIAAEHIFSQINSPSLDVSFKDGYAVVSADVREASLQHPVTLSLLGTVSAGERTDYALEKGHTIKILTGAPLPEGAEAVVSKEFTREEDGEVQVFIDAEPGRNVISCGMDVAKGEMIVQEGDLLKAAHVGLVAAAGVQEVRVYRLPRVAIIATGDEVLAPGEPFRAGAIFASNLVTISGWLSSRRIEVVNQVIKDHPQEISRTIAEMIRAVDAVITIGGAWEGDKDLVLHVLEKLGWTMIYHRVKIGPGKAIAFGLLQGKPVFCLPGGPPSNEMAFLQLAFPALMKMAGYPPFPLPALNATLAETVIGQKDWTQFIYADLLPTAGGMLVKPLQSKSRLKNMAGAKALIMIPENQESLPRLGQIEVQLLI